jgi:hypothetical protein
LIDLLIVSGDRVCEVSARNEPGQVCATVFLKNLLHTEVFTSRFALGSMKYDSVDVKPCRVMPVNNLERVIQDIKAHDSKGPLAMNKPLVEENEYCYAYHGVLLYKSKVSSGDAL